MAVGTALATIGSTLASAAASAGANALFGGGGSSSSSGMDSRAFLARTPQLRGNALTATAFAGNGQGRGFDVSLGPGWEGQLSQFSSLSNNAANQLGRLRQEVRPGFSALRDAQLSAFNNTRTRTVGDLRDQLARRRVLGSSFANDTLSRAESEFAVQEADIRARTFLQELDATQQLITQETQLRLGAVEQQIAALGLEANLGAQLISGVQSNATALAQTSAQLASQNAAANAQGLGQFFQPAIDAVGSGVSDWLSGLGGGSSTGGGKK